MTEEPPKAGWPSPGGDGRRPAVCVAVLLALLLAARPGHADTEACAQAYEKAQTLRKDAKLVSARRELVACAQDRCPSVLRKDCITWLAQLDESMPQIAVTVRGPDGCDRPEARVWLDGAPVNLGAKGLPIDVDPGPHTVRALLDGNDASRNVVLSAGEKNRVVTIAFAPDGVTCGAPKPTVSSVTPPPAGDAAHPSPETTRSPTLAYVLAGVGAVGLGVGAGFGISAWSQKGTLDDCKGACPQNDVDTMQRTFLVADVGIGIAIVSLAAAGYLYFVAR